MRNLQTLYLLARGRTKPTKEQAMACVVQLIEGKDEDDNLADLLRFFTVPLTLKTVKTAKTDFERCCLISKNQFLENPKFRYTRIGGGYLEATNGAVLLRYKSDMPEGLYCTKTQALDAQATTDYFSMWPEFSRILDQETILSNVSISEPQLKGVIECIEAGGNFYALEYFNLLPKEGGYSVLANKALRITGKGFVGVVMPTKRTHSG